MSLLGGFGGQNSQGYAAGPKQAPVYVPGLGWIDPTTGVPVQPDQSPSADILPGASEMFQDNRSGAGGPMRDPRFGVVDNDAYHNSDNWWERPGDAASRVMDSAVGAVQGASDFVRPVMDPIAGAVGGTIPVMGARFGQTPVGNLDTNAMADNAATNYNGPSAPFLGSGSQSNGMSDTYGPSPTPYGLTPEQRADYQPPQQGSLAGRGALASSVNPSSGWGTSNAATQAHDRSVAEQKAAENPGTSWQDWLPVIAAGIGAGGSIIGASALAEGEKNAADINAKAAAGAGDLAETIYNQNRADLEPWRTSGKTALEGPEGGNGHGGLNTFEQDNPWSAFNMDDPGFKKAYSFRFDEGLKALQNSMAVRGGLGSGGAQKAITKYGQDMASQEFGNSYDRFAGQRNSKMNALQARAGLGQTANQQGLQASQNYQSTAGNALMAGANSRSEGVTGAAAANASMYGAVGNAVTNAMSNIYGNYQGEKLRAEMAKILGGR